MKFVFNGRNAVNAPNNKFVNSGILAYDYNTQNGGGNSLKRIATSSDMNIGIIGTDKYNKYQAGTIFFNPDAGLQLEDGNIISPATGLEHEAAHGVNDKTGKGDHTKDLQYGTKEERAIIKGTELETAKANGELPQNHSGRKSHNEGKWVITESVISNKEKNEQESEELRKRIFNFYKSWTSE